ncbi:MAG: hypothetical protein CVU56_11860 [Deltaproteobacteria bacterium HGW-Deltaproteobacteria-14]|jgi:diguanylate cyclase (GGDEF)-like protein|nr:MAG: hypothetical protein CVU56_11860 [Deltaproteobacteria bacterium HGW-Deltaproteobacteria-14]
MTDPRPIVCRAPYHDHEGRLAVPVDPALTPELLPPPAAAAVLAAVARAADVATLVQLVGADSGLADIALALGGSPLLGTGRRPSSITEVARDLGAPALRDAALVWTVRSIIAAAPAPGFNIKRFLEDATRRASVAFAAARTAGYESPREAFTAGLLQDFGVVAMGLLCPERAGQLDLCQARPIGERVLWERAIFGGAHTEVMASYAPVWHLPPGLAHALGAHHDDVIALPDRRAQRLSELLRLADAVTDLCQVGATEVNLGRARAKLAALRTRRPMTLANLLEEAADTAPALATTLGLPVPPRCTLESLLGAPTRAALRPIQGHGGRSRAVRVGRIQRTEELHREKEHLARELSSRRSHVSLLNRLDTGTGVSSRRELCTILDGLMRQADHPAGPLSVVLVELEDAVEATGDPHGVDALAVLREAAARIREGLRADDVLGRIGSDVPAFGLLLPSCDSADGPSVVARLRDRLNPRPVRLADGREITCAAVFGGTTVPPGGPYSIEDVVAACERAIELAREGGVDVAWCETTEAQVTATGS